VTFAQRARPFGIESEVGKGDVTMGTSRGRLEDPKALRTRNSRALQAIAAGGLIAGTLDLAQALILFGRRVPFGIAAGLIGPRIAHEGGAGIYMLGVLLHFFIAFSATAIYYGVSRRLTFMIEHPLVCGFFYGIAVELVMSYVVLPLSALHVRGPFELHDIILGLVVHMFTVGLPISFAVRRFAR
jgi:hypothetical protein